MSEPVDLRTNPDNENRINGLVWELEGCHRNGDMETAEKIETELAQRGYITERAKAARAREKAAAKEVATTGSDEHRVPPNGRRTRPQSRA